MNRRYREIPVEPKCCATPGCGVRIRRDRRLCNECRLASESPLGGKPQSKLRRAYESGDWNVFVDELRKTVSVDSRGCWLWQGKVDPGGYAVGFKNTALHRIVLEGKHGKALGSQHGHHMCAVRRCVNPDHLQPVTHRENLAEMHARNSYLRLIEELQEALRRHEPDHPLLVDRIEVA